MALMLHAPAQPPSPLVCAACTTVSSPAGAGGSTSSTDGLTRAPFAAGFPFAAAAEAATAAEAAVAAAFRGDKGLGWSLTLTEIKRTEARVGDELFALLEA